MPLGFDSLNKRRRIPVISEDRERNVYISEGRWATSHQKRALLVWKAAIKKRPPFRPQPPPSSSPSPRSLVFAKFPLPCPHCPNPSLQPTLSPARPAPTPPPLFTLLLVPSLLLRSARPAPPRCSPPEAARAASIATLRSIGDAAADCRSVRGVVAAGGLDRRWGRRGRGGGRI